MAGFFRLDSALIPPKKPENDGISTRATVVRVIDGDTFVVSWNGHPVRIRPIAVWVEDGSKADERATKYLQQFVGHAIKVLVPTDEIKSVFDVFSYDRVLAWCWPLDDDESINEAIVRNGWGTAEKPKK